MTELESRVVSAISAQAGPHVRILERQSLGGGRINQVERLETTAGVFGTLAGLLVTKGCAISSRSQSAYHDAYPLEPGWRERVPIYQLYHLLNHLNLFGRSYHAGVMSIVRRFV